MSDLQTQFEQSAADVMTLSKRPSDQTMLKLYALYKQATEGDVSGKRPGFTDFAGRMKYDAWKRVSGTSTDDAMRAYVALVDELKAKE